MSLRLLVLLIVGTLPQLLEALLYPAASSLSNIASISVPITEFFPERRIIIDWCFQMNFNLPSQLSSFYNIPIWPGSHKPRVARREILQKNHTDWQLESAYQKYSAKLKAHRHPSDFTAGELYQGIEDFLASYGFHETCLLRSVCDLARHSFDDQHQNVLTDIFTFFLTPSLHEGFDASEQLYRETYESAEMRGFLNEDCAALYADCKKDLLGVITKTIFLND